MRWFLSFWLPVLSASLAGSLLVTTDTLAFWPSVAGGLCGGAMVGLCVYGLDRVRQARSTDTRSFTA